MLTGALFALGYPGAGIWPLCFVCFVPFLFAITNCARSIWDAIGFGFASGSVAQLLTCHWVFAALHVFAGFGWPSSILVGTILCAYQGGQYALCALLLWGANRKGWDVVWVAPFALAAVEWAYPQLFPTYAGAGLQSVPQLTQLAELGGAVLLAVQVMAINAALYGALRAIGRRRQNASAGMGVLRPLLVAAGLLGLALGYGQLRSAQIRARIAQAPWISVGIVQANLPPFRSREDRSLWRLRHIQQSKQLEQVRPKPDLLIWPETAVHYPLPPNAKSARQLLGPLATAVLFGGLTHDSVRGELYNSAFLADEEGLVLGRSDKLRLIPFAEYVPFARQLPVLERWLSHSGQFTPGSQPNALPFRDHRIAALNCYEELLPGLVSEVVAQTDPDLLVSLGNDIWFGRSSETYIHQALASLRAIEHRRYLVRANNSGVSSVVDAVGNVVAQTRPGKSENLLAKVALLDDPTWFERLGSVFDWFVVCVALGANLWRRRKKAFTSPSSSTGAAGP